MTQTRFMRKENNIKDEDDLRYIIKNKDNIKNYEKLNNELLSKKLSPDETIEYINSLKNNTVNKNIESRNTEVIISGDEKNASKNKYSSKVLEGIINFYNNYDKKEIPINETDMDRNGNENDIGKIKSKINDNHKNINKNKSEIIYSYYELFEDYLKKKENDKSLKFVNYINYNSKESRYIEKVHVTSLLISY